MRAFECIYLVDIFLSSNKNRKKLFHTKYGLNLIHGENIVNGWVTKQRNR